jgi:hypothetical protein
MIDVAAALTRRSFFKGIAALGLTPGGATPTAPPHGWTPCAQMPVKRSEFQAASLDGEIIVAGGFDAGAEVDALDISLGVWRRLPDLPNPVHHAGVAALVGRLYVVGGYSLVDGAAQARVQIYDPSAESWSQAASLSSGRGAFGCVAADGALYVLGGATEHLGGPVVSAVDRYDPARDQWETVAELPTPREHLAAACLGKTIWTIGGRANGDESAEFAAAVEVLDLASGTWRTLPDLPTPRAGLGAAAIEGVIATAGGERGELVFAEVEAFDPVLNAWRHLPPLPTARHGLALIANGSDRLVALGGSTLGGRVQSVAENDALAGSVVRAQ